MAQVMEITVHASTGFNHPYERFANFKPGVTLRAAVAEGENVWEATRKLQTLAESLVQAEKTETLKRLEDENRQASEDDQPELEEADVEF